MNIGFKTIATKTIVATAILAKLIERHQQLSSTPNWQKASSLVPTILRSRK